MRAIILSIVVLTFASNAFSQEVQKKESGLYFRVGTSLIIYRRAYSSKHYNFPSVGPSIDLGFNINKNWSAGIHGRVGLNLGWSSGFIFGHPTLELFSSAGVDVERKFGKHWSVIGLVNRNQGDFFSVGIGPKVTLGKSEKIGLKITAEFSRSNSDFGKKTGRKKRIIDFGFIYHLK